ncbi:MAG: hypothetical protein AAB426_15325 [Myxococcota bacterium]
MPANEMKSIIGTYESRYGTSYPAFWPESARRGLAAELINEAQADYRITEAEGRIADEVKDALASVPFSDSASLIQGAQETWRGRSCGGLYEPSCTLRSTYDIARKYRLTDSAPRKDGTTGNPYGGGTDGAQKDGSSRNPFPSDPIRKDGGSKNPF